MVSIPHARRLSGFAAIRVLLCATAISLPAIAFAPGSTRANPPTDSNPSTSISSQQAAGPGTQSQAGAPSSQDAPPTASQTSAPATSTQSIPATQAAPGASAPTTPAQATNSPQQWISSRDEVTTFKVKVNLVLVRAVVRDASGKPVGNLHKEDFELLDNKKPQTITQFVMEQPGHKTAEAQQVAEERAKALENGSTLPPPIAPDHYFAYVFDDVHLEFGDLTRVRDAAERHVNTLGPTDRAAIFTTFVYDDLDSTDDKAKLHEALQLLKMRPITRTGLANCPDVTLYMADL